MHYLSSVRLLAIISLVMHASAYAGAPFITDDPEPVEINHLEVNYAVSKTWRDHSSSVSLPSIDLNYGYSADTQLHAQPKVAYERDGSGKKYGIDNLEVGVKYRFINIEQDDTNFMLGIYPMLQLPSGDSRLGGPRGKTQLFIPLWGQYDTKEWTLYGGAGYRFNNNGADDKNSWFLGATALYQLTNRLKVGGELYRETETAIGEQSTSGFNLGSIYDINEQYHWLFSVGRALNNISASNNLSLFMALQVVY